MQVSVVICGYDTALSDDIIEAAESVLEQTNEDIEVVIVIDGTVPLYEVVVDKFGERNDVVLHCNDENLGLSRSRNVGIELASGDVIAFMDDDAVAHSHWVAELLDTYDRRDALAVGGRMTPRWVADKPEFLPPEFYWLIGVTHRGYPEEETMVRNTFGSNISFRARVLDELDGFEPSLGLVGDRQIQGEEAELAARMRREYGQGFWYNPDAIVEHKIFRHRTSPIWLTKRAFWQGYTKRVIADCLDDKEATVSEEKVFLGSLLGNSIPQRIHGLFQTQSFDPVVHLFAIFVLTAAVGLGYVYAAALHYLSLENNK